MNELNIAKTLIIKRKERGITQEELAGYMGVSKASVSKWENGQSYPDITFLPILANFFNITVDELICFEPQLSKEDICKIYKRLAKDFSEKPYPEVMAEIRELIKKYYSCFPFLYDMGMLLLNHINLVQADAGQSVIPEIIDLSRRIKGESNDLLLCRQANMMEASCYLVQEKAQPVIDLLEDCDTMMLNERILLAMGYSLNRQPEKAKEILQSDIYQNIFILLQGLLILLQLEMSDQDRAEVILSRLLSVAEAFEVEKLNPTTMLSIYLLGAQTYVVHKDLDRALSLLQKYCDLASGDIYPLILHCDCFFDKIDGWLSRLKMGVDAPVTEKFVKQRIVDGMVKNPDFGILEQNSRYKSMVQKLSGITG